MLLEHYQHGPCSLDKELLVNCTWEKMGLNSTGRISDASGEGFNTKVVMFGQN
jgi:hypothetical protein